ncbi:MAG: hypothetical protein HND58_03385 [Planctomycetota bacterium]|nr:MAG: hypothetical protein HND58_03385 [Planctomycetota bacterium]
MHDIAEGVDGFFGDVFLPGSALEGVELAEGVVGLLDVGLAEPEGEFGEGEVEGGGGGCGVGGGVEEVFEDLGFVGGEGGGGAGEGWRCGVLRGGGLGVVGV